MLNTFHWSLKEDWTQIIVKDGYWTDPLHGCSGPSLDGVINHLDTVLVEMIVPFLCRLFQNK